MSGEGFALGVTDVKPIENKRLLEGGFTPFVTDELRKRVEPTKVYPLAKSILVISVPYDSGAYRSNLSSLGVVDDYFEGSIYEIKEFAVAADFHRTGVGSTVLAAVEAEIAGHGVAAVSLQTSRTIPAYKFYQKNGYDELTENVTLIKWL